jgi:ferredoxin--NADP+ reductase
VTDQLKDILDSGPTIGAVYAIGPLPMMKAVAELTRSYGVHTLVSLNTIMVDGTGMCGGCRVTIGGEMKFACVDGPEFDGHAVDFDELMMRNRTYVDLERISDEQHQCRLAAQAKELAP